LFVRTPTSPRAMVWIGGCRTSAYAPTAATSVVMITLRELISVRPVRLAPPRSACVPRANAARIEAAKVLRRSFIEGSWLFGGERSGWVGCCVLVAHSSNRPRSAKDARAPSCFTSPEEKLTPSAAEPTR